MRCRAKTRRLPVPDRALHLPCVVCAWLVDYLRTTHDECGETPHLPSTRCHLNSITAYHSMATSVRFNFTSNSVPGAYYGSLPELPVVKAATPGRFLLHYNATQEYLGNSSWDQVYTVHFNSPDHLSVYPSETGYQYQEVSDRFALSLLFPFRRY
jgi:hypothetical protein